jgi:thiol-disulfide isomerase/thioredoxin
LQLIYKHMYKRFISNIVVFLLISTSLFAAPKGYHFVVGLKGNTDSVIYLAHYYGNKQYLDDTARLNKNGFYSFEGTEKLPSGMYVIAGQKKNKYFDFFVTAAQHIEFQCDPSAVTETMNVKGSDENKLFFDYVAFLAKKQKEVQPLQALLKKVHSSSDSTVLLRKQLDAINQEVKTYISKFIQDNEGMLATAFIKANNEPELRAYLVNSDGKADSSNLFKVYRHHFFDNIDFADGRMVYTPVLTEKIDLYLDKLTLQHIDSIDVACDYIINKGNANKDVFKFLVWYLTIRYESSEIMGFDAVFVHLVEKYYESGVADWLYPTVKDNILKRAHTLKPLLIGQPAPNMILMDTSNQPVALSGVKARYTLVFFWESTCGHCKTEMPKAIKLYKEIREKYDLQVFAVSSDTSLAAWKKYILLNNPGWINVNGNLSFTKNFHDLYDVHSTPVMFLLDEDKKILTKRILTDQISEFIPNYEKRAAASSVSSGDKKSSHP